MPIASTTTPRTSIYDRRDSGDFAVTALGTANFCRACHTGASDRDFVFTSFDRC